MDPYLGVQKTLVVLIIILPDDGPMRTKTCSGKNKNKTQSEY
jgi:hypothetical protein